MKRFIAIILVLATLLSMGSGLAGCANTTPMQMGYWLSLIAESFGMQYYDTKEPFFAHVSAENAYFGAFQMAAEWEILEPSDDISAVTEVKWRDALVTLVNAGMFLDFDAPQEEKIAFAIANFDPEIREYWLERNITAAEAVPLLDKAKEMWVNKKSETHESVSFAEEVKDLTQEEIDYESDGNVITMSAEDAPDLKPGDVYALSGISGEEEASINRVGSVEYKDGTVVITNDDEFTEEEAIALIEEFGAGYSGPLNFEDISAVYDGNGEVIYSAGDAMTAANTAAEDLSGVYVSTLDHREGDNARVVNMDSGRKTLKNHSFTKEFKIGKYTVKLNVGHEKINVGISSKDTQSNTSSKDSKLRDETQTTYITTSLEDIALDYKTDLGDRYARASIDYKLTVSGGIKYEQTNKTGRKDNPERNYKPHLSTIIGMYSTAINNFKKDVYNTKYDNKDIIICRITLLTDGLNSIDLVVKGRVTFRGELKVTMTVAGSRGIEFKDGHLRSVNREDESSLSAMAEGSFEVMFCPGLQLRFLKAISVEATVDMGVGAAVSYTAHLLDAESHLLYTVDDTAMTAEDADGLPDIQYETSAEEILLAAEAEGKTWNGYVEGGTMVLSPRACLVWDLYPIVKITGSASFDFVFYHKAISKSFDIVGKDDAFLHGHIDFPNSLSQALDANSVGEGLLTMLGVGNECSYEFKPWDDPEGSEDETVDPSAATDPTAGDNQKIMTSENVMLSSARVFLNIGETATVNIIGLPSGYTVTDLTVTSDNSSVATYDPSSGQVKAGSQAGTAQIIVKTSDGKFTTFCTVTVNEVKVNDFVGL